MFLTRVGGGELRLGRWFAIYWLTAIIFNWVLTLGEESVCVWKSHQGTPSWLSLYTLQRQGLFPLNWGELLSFQYFPVLEWPSHLISLFMF